MPVPSRGLKNHRGWGGFTTQDLKRCRFVARITALTYNWWSLFVRLANPHQHTEAITSRPLLLHAPACQSASKNYQVSASKSFQVMERISGVAPAVCAV